MTQHEHLSTEVLTSWQLGSLGDERRSAVSQHLETCARCQTAAAQFAADCKEFSEQVLPRTLPQLAERIAARKASTPLFRASFVVLPVLAAAAIALAFAFLGPAAHERPAEVEPGVRIKGAEPTVQIIARRGETVFKAEADTVLRPGDRLRFVVDPAEARNILVLGSDGTGAVVVIYPQGGKRSAAIKAGRNELPGSVELDVAPGPERFTLFFSRQPIAASAAIEALRRSDGARLDERLVAGVSSILSFVFDKERP